MNDVSDFHAVCIGYDKHGIFFLFTKLLCFRSIIYMLIFLYSRKRKQETKTPGLAKIPIIGLLFRNTEKTQSSRQVAVFVTARIMSGTGSLENISSTDQAPIKPVGEEFKTTLQDVLKVLNNKDEEQ